MAKSFSSEHRICSITSPLGKDVLLLRGLRGTDGISKLFRFELDLVSENREIQFDKIIGKPVCVTAELGSGGKRYFHGLVARFSQQAAGKELTAYRAEIVPWLWCLTRRSTCRIFQEKSVPDIVKEVFEDLEFSDHQLDLTSSYDPLPYCVQYRETDFNFVSRLLEEAGIAYYFSHEEKHHTLVLFDSPSKNKPCPGNEKVSYVAEEGAKSAPGEVGEWLAEQEMRAGCWALRDYDFKDPSLDLSVDTSTSISVGGNERFEKYDYPGSYKDISSGQKAVRLRMEAEETAARVIRGSGTCSGFTSGFRFDLKGHYRTSFNTTYLVTSVEHELSQSVGGEKNEGSEYQNRFTCIPHSVPYRPLPTTRKPRIHSAQTAEVVGAAGEEIDVDEHGRVVVKFHWDRTDARDDRSSCRVRVAQNWAGRNWGAMFHPRIDQEVIVEFLEGDPDRPIITGRVYNGQKTPPYDLPANKTQSGIKSRSTKAAGPANFNEIRFEDKKGSELFSIQAEKDFGRLVKNDETDDVQHDRTRNVGNDETVTIGSNRKVDIGKNHEETIGSDETLSVGATRSRTVGDSETITIQKSQTLSISDDRSLSVGKGQTIDVGKDQEESIGGKYQTSVAKEYILQAKKIQITADDELSIKVGKAEFILKKNGDVSLKGKKINVKGSGDVIIKGTKIAQN
jgi:type VI secretion system secreted protein VgrG